MGKMSRLYDDDFYAWTEVQAAELRKLAARPELSNMMDWDNLIEEVETLGRSDLRAAEGYLMQCLSHLIKLVSAPASMSAQKWRGEIALHQNHFRRAFAASMRRKLELDGIWSLSVINAEVGLWPEGHKPSRLLPKHCPFEIDELLADFDIDGCIAKLADMMNRPTQQKQH
jgi:hypothetical protein